VDPSVTTGTTGTLAKRAEAKACADGYQRLAGGIVRDRASLLHWGVTATADQCRRVCDDTHGCVLANTYPRNGALVCALFSHCNHCPTPDAAAQTYCKSTSCSPA
jgi:hypothetical protein